MIYLRVPPFIVNSFHAMYFCCDTTRNVGTHVKMKGNQVHELLTWIYYSWLLQFMFIWTVIILEIFEELTGFFTLESVY